MSAVTTEPAKYIAQQRLYQSGSFVFDIETCPLDEATIRERAAPFVPPDHPGEFDPKAVKCGNLKDPGKIAAKIDEAEQAHANAVRYYESDCEKLKEVYWATVIDKAPLSPVLGRVLAIGIGLNDRSNHYLCLNDATDDNERGLLDEWWNDFYTPCSDRAHLMIGHNILEFDIPFLVRRSWMLGLDVPDSVWHGKWLSPFFADTMDKWKCGSRQGQYTSLDDIARALGVGKKTEGMNGGDFHRLYFGTVPQRDEAMQYLANDVELTRSVARRLGLI